MGNMFEQRLKENFTYNWHNRIFKMSCESLVSIKIILKFDKFLVALSRLRMSLQILAIVAGR